MIRQYRKPYRIKKKKSILRNRFFWLANLFLIVIGAILYFLFISEFFQIKKVNVTGQQKVSRENIESFVPRRNIFLFDTKTTEQDILDNLPKIAEVKIDRTWPNTLDIAVVERIGIALWLEGEQYFLMDKGAVIFEKISEAKPGLVKISGQVAIEKDSLDKILKINQDLLENLKIEAEQFVLLAERVNVKTLAGWQIYFSLEQDIDWQITKLRVVLEEKIPIERVRDLDYIDLRFGNLAPYKYKD